MTALYTIGHSTRSLDEFLALLEAHGVERLVDVRRYPGSRRFPHFAREALAESLEEAGLEYVHEPELGGRRRPRPDSPNTHWRNDQFRAYADHLASAPFQRALERVRAVAEGRTTALMCAEAVHWRCHRQLIADVLVARGHEVRHIHSSERAPLHELNPAAHPADNHLVYPSDDQLSLL